MDNLFFNGVWRMDWGLGNPNKTAALIAVLMVASWGAACFRRGFWLSLLSFTVLGGCLVHTLSRGGVISAFAGLIPLALFAPRPWPRRKIVALCLSVWAIVGFAIFLNAHARYGQGLVAEDRSVSNRIDLWSFAPRMMVDAPGGWGLGKSGERFVQWYQPPERSERYRTMVNSHLTWLVEFGWPLRFLYLFAWGAVILLCWPTANHRWLAVPLGIWIAFAVAAFFSSVAETPWLWIVPGMAFLSALLLRPREWPSLKAWLLVGGSAAALCLGLYALGQNDEEIRGSKRGVVLGKGRVSTWLIVDERVPGGINKTLRQRIQGSGRSVGVVWSLDALPSDLGDATVAILGAPAGGTQPTMERVLASAAKTVLVAPGYYPAHAGAGNASGRVEVFFGEFSQSPFLAAWEETGKVRRIPGVGDYYPGWAELVLQEENP